MLMAQTVNIGTWLSNIANLMTALLAVAAILGATRGVWRRTVAKRARFKSALNHLGVGMNPTYVDSLLGRAAMGSLTTDADGTMTWVSAHGYVSVSFRRGYAVQVAVTVTDPILRFDVGQLTFDQLRGRLGDRIAPSFGEAAAGYYYSLGARRQWSLIGYFFGNPGGYLYYALAHNDASPLGRSASMGPSASPSAYTQGIFSDPEEVCPIDRAFERRLAREMIPNTLILRTAEATHFERDNFGADLDAVRLLLRETTYAERILSWWRRRRWEKAATAAL
ncbi:MULTISPECIES: ETEC_3214 domain-containing protein [unclassified Knoellia]|uniref:ETEC_3214 domain-containing protein n=1 Tax=Knoellia altitudinis TaxID=3404795 RepID=UPI0036228052